MLYDPRLDSSLRGVRIAVRLAADCTCCTVSVTEEIIDEGSSSGGSSGEDSPDGVPKKKRIRLSRDGQMAREDKIKEIIGKALPPIVDEITFQSPPTRESATVSPTSSSSGRASPPLLIGESSISPVPISSSSLQQPLNLLTLGTPLPPPPHITTNNKFSNVTLLRSCPSTNPAAAAYFRKVEGLSYWFIETASRVDVSDVRAGGRWEVSKN